MKLEAIDGGLRIIEDCSVFELIMPVSTNPLDELTIRAALALVSSAPESDGKNRSTEILREGDGQAVQLAQAVCSLYLRRPLNG